MHAIGSLLSGIRGAEGGYARIYARGTTTRATWYSTFEGDDANSSGADIDLDENGGAEIYVSELVDVVVLDSDGAEVRRFTDGASASNVEVRSQSFTGVDYDDASTGAGSNYPLSLQAVLDRWKDKTGSIDWDVLLGGQTQTLLEVLGALAGPPFYNVKSDTYGAVGDGVADDTVAINAAFTAAAVSGGIVFFPAGTYNITSAIAVGSNTSILGCGSAVSVINTNHASNQGFTFSGSSDSPRTVRGITVGCAVSCSGTRVAISGNANVRFEACDFGDTNLTGYSVQLGGASTRAIFLDCYFTGVGATTGIVGMSANTGLRYHFERCTFVTQTAGAYNPSSGAMVLAIACTFVDCLFDGSLASGGTFAYYAAATTTLNARMRGCTFAASGGATITAISLGIYAASSYFEESESVFGNSVTAYSYTSVDGVADQSTAVVKLLSRESRTYYATQGATPFSIGSVVQQYGRIVINDTLGNMTISFANDRPPHGAKTRIAVWNTSGAPAAITYNDPLSGDVAVDAAIADDDAFVYDYVFHVFSASGYGYSGLAFDAGFGF